MNVDVTPAVEADEARHHPNGLAVLWAATAYPLAAFLWAMAAGVSVAADSATGPGEAIGWFMWATLWTSIAAVVGAMVAIPILALELLLWRYLVTRVPYFERDRFTLVESAALLAIPWALFNPLPWGGLITFVTAFVGLALSRMLVARLAPGALL